MSAAAVPVAVSLAVSLASGSASGSDRLTWIAPQGCPTHDEVARAIDRDDSTASNTDVDTSAIVTSNGADRWRVVIVVRSDKGELRRELELDSCAAAAEAVVLVHDLALAQQPEAPPDVVPIPTPPPVDPPANEGVASDVVTKPDVAPPPVRTREAPPPVPRRRSTPPVFVLDLQGGGGVGSLPRGGGHVMLGFAAQWRWIRLGARLDHAIVRRSFVDAARVGTNVSTTTGGLALHVPVAAGPVTVLPGIGVRAGGARARGIGGSARLTRWVPWALVGVGVDLVWMPSRTVGVRVGAELELPVVRHRFTFDSLETARTRSVGGLFLAGLEIRFPRAPR